MNDFILTAGNKTLSRIFLLFFLCSFYIVPSYAQSSCEYARDIDFEVIMGVTTLSVEGDQCYTMTDKLVITCIDNISTPSRDTFNYDNCNALPPGENQRELTISEFSANVDLSGCHAVEVLFPDGSVGYYDIIEDLMTEPGSDFSGFLNNEFCEDECLVFSVVDAWGSQIGTTAQTPCCVDGEIIFVDNCIDCNQVFNGICDPLPGECGYPSVDFGCVEIDRSSTRTFYVNACPFVKDQRRITGRNGEESLHTGIIECYYPSDNLGLDREGLLLDHCEIIIHDIQIHAEHQDDMTVRNGLQELPFSLVGDFEFPITLKRGDNLPFEVKFAPYFYGYDDAVVTICYEDNGCACDRIDPRRGQDNSRDGMHCETTNWYDFRVSGEGKDCQGILGDNECISKCPECIFTPEAIITNGSFGAGPCGGYIDYTIGYAGPDAPPATIPDGRGVFSCGDLSLNTVTGQLYIFDAGFDYVERVPGDGEWIPTSPAPYNVGPYELDCNQDFKIGSEIPYIPYLFFDDGDSEMYLVPGYGRPVEQVDIIVSLNGDNTITRNLGYIDCGDYEPGDVFYIHPNDMEVRQDEADSGIAYEFIACDGYRLFAKLSDPLSDPLLPCNFYAEFTSTFSMGFYQSINNGVPVRENVCDAWDLDYCNLTRTDLLVVHNEADEGYDEFICDLGFRDVARPDDRGCNVADFGCILQGNSIQNSFDLFHCTGDFFRFREGAEDNTREEEMNIDCSYFTPPFGPKFGQGCEITIHSIEIVDEYINGDQVKLEENISDHFSLVQPMTFPVTISFEAFEEMLIEFNPTETGFHDAFVVICYENTCSSCNLIDRNETSRNGEEAGHCNYEDYVFEIVGCSYEFSNTDENLDGELEIVDPCSCGDPQNVYGGPSGELTLFHDFISVGGMGIDQTFDIEVDITSGVLYDDQNVALPFLGDNGRIQLNWDPVRGAHFLEFWTEPGIGYSGTIYVNGTASMDPDAMLESICDGPCAAIPTIGEWGIILLSLLISIVGLIGLKQPDFKPEVLRK